MPPTEAWQLELWRRKVREIDLADPANAGVTILLGVDHRRDSSVFINLTGMQPEKWKKLTSEERSFVPVALRPWGWDPMPPY